MKPLVSGLGMLNREPHACVLTPLWGIRNAHGVQAGLVPVESESTHFNHTKELHAYAHFQELHGRCEASQARRDR
jgi:hypothetical protein